MNTSQKELDAARARQRLQGVSAYDRLRTIVYGQRDEDLSGELTAIIAEMEIDKKSDAEIHLLFKARDRYQRAIADGLLQRVRADRTLFYGADDLLASANMSLEDDELLDIALAETSRNDTRAEAAASVLGPQAVGRMIEPVLEERKQLRDANGKYKQAASDRHDDLLARIGHTAGASLVAAARRAPRRRGTRKWRIWQV